MHENTSRPIAEISEELRQHSKSLDQGRITISSLRCAFELISEFKSALKWELTGGLLEVNMDKRSTDEVAIAAMLLIHDGDLSEVQQGSLKDSVCRLLRLTMYPEVIDDTTAHVEPDKV